MKFLPFENYKLISALKPEEAIKKLATAVVTSGPATLLSSSKSDKYYKGKLNDSGFEISRIIGYRNSFRPVIKGEIYGSAGSEIHIKMRMHKVVLIFCCVWIGGVLLASVASIFAQINAGLVSASGLIPFAMLLLAYTLITGGFKYESIQSKKLLQTIFEAEEVQ